MLLVRQNGGLEASGTIRSLLGSLRRFQRLLATKHGRLEAPGTFGSLLGSLRTFQRLLESKNDCQRPLEH